MFDKHSANYVITRAHYLYMYAFVLICVRQCIQFLVNH